MKTFSELLDTKQIINVKVTYNGNTIEESYDLMDPISIRIKQEQDTVIDSIMIDDFELIPAYNHLLPNSSPFVSAGIIWELRIEEPFYQWKHKVTHQGWLFYQNVK